jgi:hypothetical protein
VPADAELGVPSRDRAVCAVLRFLQVSALMPATVSTCTVHLHFEPPVLELNGILQHNNVASTIRQDPLHRHRTHLKPSFVELRGMQ